MSVQDWLASLLVFGSLGIALVWSLFNLADHLRGNRENYLQPEASSDPEDEEWEQGECREPCPPEVTLLAEYARSDSSGIRIAQKTETDEDFEAFRETSPARIILIDLVKITGTLADDSEGPCWDQVDLLRSFGAASGDRDISRMPRTPTMALLEGYRIEQSSTLLALWVLAVRNDPDRHRLRDMYIGFARLAAEYNMERLDEVIKMIWDASEPEVEVHDDAAQGVEGMRADLAEQLNARHREVLGVAANSTRDEIKAAYHRQVVLWHPDRLEGMAPELRAVATERLKEINEAFEWMSDSVGI